MNREEIKLFFDEKAKNWDKNVNCDNKKIEKIFNCANIKENIDVLDVGCGTGVLFNYYLRRNVKSIKAIDISEEMIKIAKNKYSNSNINIECIDAYKYNNGKYDAIMLYDCFPHFEVEIEAEDEEEALTIAEDEVHGRDFNDGDEDYDIWSI